VRTSTATAASPIAAHCGPRSRSLKIPTPKAMLTSGVMKYPSEASTTCPLIVAQMNSAQLIEVSTLARVSRARSRGRRRIAATCRRRPSASTSSPIATGDQSTRRARISTGPVGSTSGQ